VLLLQLNGHFPTEWVILSFSHNENGCYNDLDTSSKILPHAFTVRGNSFDKAEEIIVG
jgi:hypothetical protein